MSVVTVYAIFADPAEAQRIGMSIVEEKLAACVNILGPCRSIYRWEAQSRPRPKRQRCSRPRSRRPTR